MTEVQKGGVLVVDDESSNIIALTKTLGPEYTVRAAINGRDAIKTAEKYLPDIILLDVVMPEMDGYAVIAELKNSDKTKDIPVIFLTAMANPENEEKGLALGAADYISKPFSPAIVRIRVRNQIQIVDQLRMIAAANRAKSDFLANMSHEIRTPINAILGISEIMMQDKTTPKNIRDNMNMIYKSGELLLGIINDILDLSKIEAGGLELVHAGDETANLISSDVYEPMPYGNVLIVDDVESNLFVAEGLLRPYELFVDAVTSGFDAIDRIRNGNVYDLVFMDHRMPKMDGIEATAIIRGLGYTNPIVALTADTVKGRQEMFLENGFDGFVSKPIDKRQLSAVLKKFIRDRQPRDVLERARNAKAETLSPDHPASLKDMRGKDRLPADIPGLDMNKGRAHFGLKEDVFIGVLRSYAKNTRQLLGEIREVHKDGLNEYAIIVHGIKGSSFGIFAETAGSEAKALENAAIAGNYDFVSANNQKFLDTVFQLVADIEDALAKSGREQKPTKEKPDEPLLARLIDACGKYDIDGADAAMAEMESYKYTSDDGLVAWLREKLDQGKYRSIIEAFDSKLNE